MIEVSAVRRDPSTYRRYFQRGTSVARATRWCATSIYSRALALARLESRAR